MIPCACAGVFLFVRRQAILCIALAGCLILLSADDWLAVKRTPLLISEDPKTYLEAQNIAAELIHWGMYRGDTAVLWDSSENIWPPLLYYLIQKHPDNGHIVPWNDPAAKSLFILLDRGDHLSSYLDSRPGISQLYSRPQLVQVTGNSDIYLARRL